MSEMVGSYRASRSDVQLNDVCAFTSRTRVCEQEGLFLSLRSRDGIEIAAVPVPSVTKFSTMYEIRY